jgi:hypothetical protein
MVPTNRIPAAYQYRKGAEHHLILDAAVTGVFRRLRPSFLGHLYHGFGG